MIDSGIALQIFGTQQLADTFAALAVDVQDKIVNQSFRKASKLIIAAAKTNLSVGLRGRDSKGKTVASLGSSLQKHIKTMVIGAKKRKGGQKAHLFESGTQQRSYRINRSNQTFRHVSGNVHNTGKITAIHFFENAINSTETQVKDTIYREVKSRYEKYLRRQQRLTSP